MEENMIAIIGKKVGMSQIYNEMGDAFPVTLVEAGPCKVIQVKTKEKDGYSALQLGFDKKPERLVNEPEKGHYKTAKSDAYRVLKEFRSFESDYCEVGKEVKADIFQIEDKVDVRGVSKGKGFQGVVKRYNFKGGPKTHGQGDRLRAPGSVGQSADPSRVVKGIKMPGRTGGDNVTIKGLKVLKVNSEKNLLYIKGAIPGANNSTVIIKRQER